MNGMIRDGKVYRCISLDTANDDTFDRSAREFERMMRDLPVNSVQARMAVRRTRNGNFVTPRAA